MNISYESVLEDMFFRELQKIREKGISDKEIYQTDLWSFLKEYINPSRKSKLCIKFGEPRLIEIEHFWEKYSYGKKHFAKEIALEDYKKVMSMQTPFPPNVFLQQWVVN